MTTRHPAHLLDHSAAAPLQQRSRPHTCSETDMPPTGPRDAQLPDRRGTVPGGRDRHRWSAAGRPRHRDRLACAGRHRWLLRWKFAGARRRCPWVSLIPCQGLRPAGRSVRCWDQSFQFGHLAVTSPLPVGITPARLLGSIPSSHSVVRNRSPGTRSRTRTRRSSTRSASPGGPKMALPHAQDWRAEASILTPSLTRTTWPLRSGSSSKLAMGRLRTVSTPRAPIPSSAIRAPNSTSSGCRASRGPCKPACAGSRRASVF